jgi:hypothetical protein
MGLWDLIPLNPTQQKVDLSLTCFLAAVHHFVNLQKGLDQPLLFLVVRCTVAFSLGFLKSILIIVLGVSWELVALHLLMPCSAWCRVNLAVHPLCQIRMRLRLKIFNLRRTVTIHNQNLFNACIGICTPSV